VTLRSAATALVFILLALLTVGCGSPLQSPDTPLQGAALRGTLHGGQQPVAGAHVYLFAANTTGYGNASVSLLNSANTGHSDSVGAYVLSGSDGSFGIGGDYTCTPNTQVYLYALGGDPGGGTNSRAAFMAVLGNCPSADNFATATPSLFVNEVTTVAAAYAMAGYATDAKHVSSSGTALAQVGIANAFANAGNLVNIATGNALTTTPAGNGTVPASTIYTVANILAACINSADQTGTNAGQPSPACNSLVTTATSLGNGNGTTAGDTATAAINIAHFPAYSVSTLYNIPNGNYVFSGGITSGTAPSDLSLAITFTGGGMSNVRNLAVDASGNVWASDIGSRIVVLSPLGAISSGSNGYRGSSINGPLGMAFDTSGNCWFVNGQGSNSTVGYVNSTGAPSSSTLSLSDFGDTLTFDKSGNLWVPTSSSSSNGTLTEIAGGAVTHTYSIGGEPGNAAVDAGNYLWDAVNGDGTVSKLTGGSVVSPSPYTMSFNNSAVPSYIALDSSGDIWALGSDDSLSAITSTGTAFSNAPYSGSGLAGVELVLDGTNAIFTLDEAYNFTTHNYAYTVSKHTYSSGALTTVGTFTPAHISNFGAYSIAVDGSGNVWVAALSQVDEYIGMATPIVTPVVANLLSPYSGPVNRP
jgi:hypothetical protein